jgi:hypothetical protein
MISNRALCKYLTGIPLLLSAATLLAQDFSVTSPGFFFRINGEDGPTLTLVRGQTYTFQVATTPGFHPFRIVSPGVVNNNISSGTITYTVPTAAMNYHYNCGLHGDQLRGEIITTNTPAAPPPVVQIVGLTVGTNLVLTSTGTNTWTTIPEFSTNLASGSWFAVTVQSNRYFNGTNEMFCGRPPGDAVYLRIRAQQNP